jgi:hypothetical protein
MGKPPPGRSVRLGPGSGGESAELPGSSAQLDEGEEGSKTDQPGQGEQAQSLEAADPTLLPGPPAGVGPVGALAWVGALPVRA